MMILLLINSNLIANNKEETYIATYYCLKGKTASGSYVKNGIIAADIRLIPMHSIVLIDDIKYTVKDTGKNIKGKRIDIWVSNCSTAIKKGKRKVRLKIIK